MKLYAAPMEGVTGYVYRNAHRKYFGGVDKYFTPFLTPKKGKGWTSREKNDIAPEHNQNIRVTPQILTNQADDFAGMAQKLADCGYEEVNLNLGCPSGTVVSKGKGCGFLTDRDRLLSFFENVFERIEKDRTDIRISVKTRLGKDSPEEIVPLMEIYNQFPLSEVILHARIHRDFYKKPVNREAFQKAFLLCRHPLCYNGDIFAAEDFHRFQKAFPKTDRVMLGRGLIANPQLAESITVGGQTDPKRWKAFHDEVCRGYEEIMSGERNVLFKMKELWSYMLPMFEDSEKLGKQIRKSTRLAEYKEAVERLFLEKRLTPGASDGNFLI